MWRKDFDGNRRRRQQQQQQHEERQPGEEQHQHEEFDLRGEAEEEQMNVADRQQRLAGQQASRQTLQTGSTARDQPPTAAVRSDRLRDQPRRHYVEDDIDSNHEESSTDEEERATADLAHQKFMQEHETRYWQARETKKLAKEERRKQRLEMERQQHRQQRLLLQQRQQQEQQQNQAQGEDEHRPSAPPLDALELPGTSEVAAAKPATSNSSRLVKWIQNTVSAKGKDKRASQEPAAAAAPELEELADRKSVV